VVYIGAGGNIMEKGWRELLSCIRHGVPPVGVRIELLGTDTNWRENRRTYLQDVAERAGLRDMVSEDPERISYDKSMRITADADGLLVLGVDDPNYRPSKLQTCLAAGLPLLVVAHADSELPLMLARSGPGVHVLKFGGADADHSANVSAVVKFFGEVAAKQRWTRSKRLFLSPTDAAEGHAALFDRVVESGRR
jgi:hypothetical protein